MDVEQDHLQRTLENLEIHKLQHRRWVNMIPVEIGKCSLRQILAFLVVLFWVFFGKSGVVEFVHVSLQNGINILFSIGDMCGSSGWSLFRM